MNATPEPTRELNCTNCGAPISYLEGEAVLTCPYCGTTSMLAGYDNIVRVQSHYILPATLDRTGARVAASSWMSQGFFKAGDLTTRSVFEQEEGVVLPFWVVRTRARTFWSGMDRQTRSVGSGDNRHTEEYWEPVSGDFSEDQQWVVYARENEDEHWGLKALNPGSRSVQGLTVCNGQMTQERAEKRATNDIVAVHRQRADSKADRITDCDTTVDVLGADLVHLPVWKIRYAYKGKSYRLLLNGHTGNVISGEAPVGKWDKVVMLSIIMGVLAVLFGLIAGLTDLPHMWIGTGVCAGIAVLYTAWTALFSKA
jgi:predicted RNA-binding Zn-ribbon protein involved in translation (DUF1610 family)